MRHPGHTGRLGWLAALAAFAIGGTACSDDDKKESAAGVLVYDDFPESSFGADRSDLGLLHAIVLKAGFAGGQAVQYVDFGEVNPVVPQVYVPAKGGVPVAGQYPIIDTLPDKADYSTYWQVVLVDVPSGYKANDIKSKKGIEDAGFDMTPTMKGVHCAVVNPDAYWLTADESATLNVFWATGEDQPNPYFDPEVEPSPDNPMVVDETAAKEGDIVLQPVWHKRLLGFCYTEGLDDAHQIDLVDEEGVVQLDTDAVGMRYDTGLLPVFSAENGGLAVAAETSPTVNGQPGAATDVDTENAAPYAVVDNPVLGALALDRFEVTFKNTTPVPPDSKSMAFGAGGTLVADADGADLDGDETGEIDTAYLYVEGLPVAPEVAALIVDSNTVPLANAFPTDLVYGPFADFHLNPPLPADASYTIVVTASPFLGVLSTVHALPGESDAFVGAAAALYDGDFAPIADQTVDLMVFGAGLETEEGVVVPSEDHTDPVGTLTIKHL